MGVVWVLRPAGLTACDGYRADVIIRNDAPRKWMRCDVFRFYQCAGRVIRFININNSTYAGKLVARGVDRSDCPIIHNIDPSLFDSSRNYR